MVQHSHFIASTKPGTLVVNPEGVDAADFCADIPSGLLDGGNMGTYIDAVQ